MDRDDLYADVVGLVVECFRRAPPQNREVLQGYLSPYESLFSACSLCKTFYSYPQGDRRGYRRGYRREYHRGRWPSTLVQVAFQHDTLFLCERCRASFDSWCRRLGVFYAELYAVLRQLAAQTGVPWDVLDAHLWHAYLAPFDRKKILFLRGGAPYASE
jgi:hypothetical protein